MIYDAFLQRCRRIFARKETKLLFCCVISALLWGVAAHAYGLLNSGFSHDSLNAIFADSTEDLCKYNTGRFLVPVYRLLFRGALAMPWFIGLLAFLYIGAGAYFICRCIGAESKALAVAVTGILTVNPSVISQIGTYIHELDVNMLSFLLAALAAFLWMKNDGWRAVVLPLLPLILAVGIYQCFLSVTATLMVLVSLRALFAGRRFREVFFKGLVGILTLVLAGAIYYLLAKLFGYGSVPGDEGRISPPTGLFSILITIKEVYRYAIGCLLEYDFSGRIAFMPVVMGLMLLCTAFPVLRALHAIGRGRGAEKALAVILLLLTPIAMNTVGILSPSATHHIMLYALWLVPCFSLVLAAEMLRSTDRRVLFALGSAIWVFAAVFCFYNIRIGNAAYLKKDLQQQAELSQLTRVIAALEAREDYTLGETEVIFCGSGPITRTSEGYDETLFLTGMTSTGMIYIDAHARFYHVYGSYFRFILNYPLRICPEEMREDLLAKVDLDSIPKFPQAGYIQNVDGILLVNMG